MARPRVLVLVAAAAAAVFVALLLAVAVHPGPLPLDSAVRNGLLRISGPASERDGPDVRFLQASEAPSSPTRRLMRPIARLGAREVLIPLLLVGGAALSFRRRTPGPLMMLAGSYFGMALMVGPAKTLLHRPEPFDGPGAIGRSFPSGHAAQAVLVYGMLAALALAEPLAARARTAVRLGAVLTSAAVGAAVLLREAHWLSDMVGGYAVGVVWLAGPLALAERFPWLISRMEVLGSSEPA